MGDVWSKQADQLDPCVAPIHVQGEQTAIFAADHTQGPCNSMVF